MAKNPLALSDTVSDEELDAVLARVVGNGEEVDAMVYRIVDSHCAAVDKIIQQIQTLLDKHKEIPDAQLDRFIIQIPGNLYFSCTGAEALGIRDDIARLMYKEKFNRARASVQGTVADKDSFAEQQASPEALATVIYNRAYRMIKAKLDMAYEMLTALKKVVSRRISEIELSNSDTGRSRQDG